MAGWDESKQTMVGPSTLWAAAKANDVAELSRLLDAGAPVDEKDPRGFSALMLATYAGNAEAFELLLARKADPNSRDAAGNTVLMGAAFKGNVELVRKLIAAGGDPSLKNMVGMDARAFATQFGQPAIVAVLDEVQGKE